MIDEQEQALRKKLDELSERVRKSADQFKKSGEFSDVHRTLLTEIQHRNDALRERVRQAETAGSTWELIKAEFVRDISSLQDDLLEFEDRLDSEAIEKRHPSEQ
jgi:phosphoenolpyruvate-protein kinase (PTS system EI component)